MNSFEKSVLSVMNWFKLWKLNNVSTLIEWSMPPSWASAVRWMSRYCRNSYSPLSHWVIGWPHSGHARTATLGWRGRGSVIPIVHWIVAFHLERSCLCLGSVQPKHCAAGQSSAVSQWNRLRCVCLCSPCATQYHNNKQVDSNYRWPSCVNHCASGEHNARQ